VTRPTNRLAALFLIAIGAAAPLSAEQAILIGAGDIAVCTGRFGFGRPDLEQAHKTAALIDLAIAEHGELTVFTTGDHAYFRGTEKDFQRCYEPTWGRFKTITRPTPGDHDYKTKDAAPYYDYFGDNAGPRSLGYYSYDVGDWHVVALNSLACKKRNIAKVTPGGCEAQLEWLAKDLAASAASCTLAYMHDPPFNSGHHGNIEEIWPLFQVLYRHDVDLLVTGHQHSYERFEPMGIAEVDGALRPHADPERGILTIVAGTGGRGLKSFGKRRVSGSVVSADKGDRAWGVLELTLRPGAYDFELITVADSTFTDKGSGRCH